MKSTSNSSIFKNATIVVAITLLTKVLSFAKELVYSYQFGTSNVSDAYYTANIIPNLINTPYFTGMLMSFVPTFIALKNREGRGETDKYSSNTLFVYTTISAALGLILMILSPYIIEALYSVGEAGADIQLASNLMRLSCISFPITMVAWINIYVCQSNNDFTLPQIYSLLNIVISTIGIALLSRAIGIYAVPLAGILAWLVQTILQCIYTRRYFLYRFYVDLRANYLKESLYLAMPIFVTVGAEQLNHTIDNVIAMRFASGTISVLNYSQKLFNLFNTIVPTSIITVMYPILSDNCADLDKLKKTIKHTEVVLMELIIPITIICEIMAVEIVQVIFMRGSFTINDAIDTADVLRMYILALPFWGVRELYNRCFFVHEDSKTPMIVTLISCVLNIILSVVLSYIIGITGIAIATTISCIFACFFSRYYLQKRIGKNGTVKMGKSLIQAIFSSVLMLFAVLIFLNYVKANIYVKVFISSMAGTIVYGISMCFLKNEDAIMVLKKAYNYVKYSNR